MSDRVCSNCTRLQRELSDATSEADATFECLTDERQRRKDAERERDAARLERNAAVKLSTVACAVCKHGRVLGDECPNCHGEGTVSAVAEVARLKTENLSDRAVFKKACEAGGDEMMQIAKGMQSPPTIASIKESHWALLALTFEEFAASLYESIGANADYAKGVWISFRDMPEWYITSRSPDVQGEMLLAAAMKKLRDSQ